MAASTGGATKSGGGGFKKGGFKSSFAAVKGSGGPVRKNVLGDDDDHHHSGSDDSYGTVPTAKEAPSSIPSQPGRGENAQDDAESDTDDDGYTRDRDGGYYDPRRPTDCSPSCASLGEIKAIP